MKLSWCESQDNGIEIFGHPLEEYIVYLVFLSFQSISHFIYYLRSVIWFIIFVDEIFSSSFNKLWSWEAAYSHICFTCKDSYLWIWLLSLTLLTSDPSCFIHCWPLTPNFWLLISDFWSPTLILWLLTTNIETFRRTTIRGSKKAFRKHFQQN